MRILRLLPLVLLFPLLAGAQVSPVAPPADSAKAKQDSIKGDITTTIKYSARDSIVFDVAGKIVKMYGESNIDYGDISLKAAQTSINYQTSIINASGSTDSTGKKIGTPVFKQGAEMYTAEQMAYNFKTKKGRTTGVVTRQGEGFLHAEVVKRTTDEAIWASQARYTTCDLPDPHFFISSTKMKAYPGKKIFSGPFNLVFADIPTPLGFLFGYFPTPSKKKSTGNSGIIVPTFGETREQGFYLRQGGVYLALNEYIGVSLLGDIYSFGSYGATLNSNYTKRYAYQGNLNLAYNVTKYPDNTREPALSTGPARFSASQPRSFWIQWSHSPAPRPGGKFSASVRAGSSFPSRLSGYTDPRQNLSAAFNSSIQYQLANPNSPITLTASALQNQNVITKQMDLTLPEVTLGVNRQYPFRLFSKNKTGGNFIQDIAIGYNLTTRNQLTNRIQGNYSLPGNPNIIGTSRRDSTLSINRNNLPTILRNGQFGMQHSFPISMNSIQLLKYFSLSPSFNYSATSYLKELDYTYIDAANAVRVDTINKFSLASTYSAGASLSTRIYGMATINGKRVQAIRHQLQPSVSYNYSPELTRAYGQEVQLSNILNSTTGMVPTQYLSRYNNFIFGTPSSQKQSAIAFSLQNNIEAKVKAKGDTATTYEKVSIIDNFSFSSGYNFAADSFKLSNINAQFRTVLFKRFNFFSSADFDPYQTNSLGTRVDRLLLSRNTFQFARLTSANLNLSFDLNPESFRGKQEEAPKTNRPSLETDQELQQQYVDFTIPWTFQVNFTAGYFASPNQEARVTKSLGFDGSLSLTDKWKFTYNSGYDFENKSITYTSINIHRDLHCWDMSISWIPFGTYQSYNVSINARSSILRDLKLTRSRTWFNR